MDSERNAGPGRSEQLPHDLFAPPTPEWQEEIDEDGQKISR